MDRVNGHDWIDIGGGRRGFRSQNAGAGVPGTEVTDDFLNSIQEELLKVIEAAGLEANAADLTQLWQALNRMVLPGFGGRLAWMPVLSLTVTAPPGGAATGDAYIVPEAATGAWAGQGQKLAIWAGGGWVLVPTKDGHGVSLPDGRVFVRIAGVYVELLATDARAGLIKKASQAQVLAAVADDTAVTPAGLAFSARNRKILSYTVAGTYSFTVPDGIYRIKVRVVGPGGGGGYAGTSASSNGGGGGGYAEGWFNVTPGDVYTVSVGYGGNGGTAVEWATPGTTSSFGSLISATSGARGDHSGVGSTNAPGGVGIGGQINIAGGAGRSSMNFGGTLIGGDGGCPAGEYSTQAFFSLIPGLAGPNGTSAGQGGAGAVGTASTGTNGGSGAAGIVVVEY